MGIRPTQHRPHPVPPSLPVVQRHGSLSAATAGRPRATADYLTRKSRPRSQRGMRDRQRAARAFALRPSLPLEKVVGNMFSGVVENVLYGNACMIHINALMAVAYQADRIGDHETTRLLPWRSLE